MVPYNVPSPALDLLKRFLTGKSFVDVETPQIRHSSHPTKLEHYAGAEKWMNTPAYPKLPIEHNHAVVTPAYDYLANFPSWTIQRMEPIGNTDTSSFAWGSGLSFIAGMVVSMVIMQLVNARLKQGQRGYEPVPEASLDDE
jgi:hypothetical protein